MKIVSIAISKEKGVRKTCVDEAQLLKDYGLEGDAHAGPWHRQISLLSLENIEATREKGVDVTFGDFAENISTVGIDWKNIPIGTRVKLGDSAEVEITQIGKKCHTKCEIFYQVGDCIMPKEGVFARVIEGGKICCGDPVNLMK